MSAGTRSPARRITISPGTILGVTVINALIGHIQESNAEKSLQGIRNMLSSDKSVRR
jgi:magnesium-transporting ATPase (P-type)